MTEYPKWSQSLICRTRFNRGRRRLRPYIERLQQKVTDNLRQEREVLVVDSIPVPVVKMARERTHKAFKKDFETAPAKGYSAENRDWFIGYKLHVIIYDNGVVQQSGITKGNVHGINFLKQLRHLPKGKFLLGDRAYRSSPLQMELIDQFKVKPKVPFKINQTD